MSILMANNGSVRYELHFWNVGSQFFPLKEEDIEIVLQEIKKQLLLTHSVNGGYTEHDGTFKIHRVVGQIHLNSINNSMKKSLDIVRTEKEGGE